MTDSRSVLGRHLGALLLASLVAASPAATRLAVDAVDVYRSGEEGYHTFRIPSVIAAADGTLLAFAEGRRLNRSDTGDIDLVLKRSHDGGRTWSALEVIGDNGPNTFGNPCPVVDRQTGTIWLFSTHNRGGDREPDITSGSADPRTVWVQASRDHGRSWGNPVDVSIQTRRAHWRWYATGPGIGIQLRTGRLVIPANHSAGGEYRAHLIYSDDGGRSWAIGGIADPGTNESQVVELSDGRLLLNMRNHPPKPVNRRLVATSIDGGLTLSVPRPDEALVEPPTQASLIRWPVAARDGRHPLVFANPASTRRERFTVRLSEDEGVTWPFARVLHEGPSAYSGLVALDDGVVGVLFERGDTTPYERITFARVTRDWLRQASTRP